MKIAIVGTGVSGLVAAHLLKTKHQLTLYEAADYVGGHTNTIRVDTAYETQYIDTGFIAMNNRNYPHFTALLKELGVRTRKTHMSFSVKDENEDFEYAGTPMGLFCQPKNLVSPSFHKMIHELFRFNKELKKLLLTEENNESLSQFLERLHFSSSFTRRLIVPQVSAVWSADPRQMDSFPVRFIAEFFDNHGMLGFRDRPAWSTIKGGSSCYVNEITKPFQDSIRLASPVASITRYPEHVTVHVKGQEPENYDQVIIAVHSDQALAMLEDAGPEEQRILGAIPYQQNEVVLHTDSSLLPRRHHARSAWNFHLLKEPKPLTTVTYYMNLLQGLKSRNDYCVTLNHSDVIGPDKIIKTISYAHPVYTAQGMKAQKEQARISLLNTRTHYCGAYWGWGFHEDGVKSAIEACQPLL